MKTYKCGCVIGDDEQRVPCHSHRPKGPKLIWKCGCERDAEGQITRCSIHTSSKESDIPDSLKKLLLGAKNALKVGDLQAAELLRKEAVRVCGDLYSIRGAPRPPKRIMVKLVDLKLQLEEVEGKA